MLTKLSILLHLLDADFGLQQTHLSLSWAQTCNSTAESLTLAIACQSRTNRGGGGVGLKAYNTGSRFSRRGRKTSFKKTNVLNVLLLWNLSVLESEMITDSGLGKETNCKLPSSAGDAIWRAFNLNMSSCWNTSIAPSNDTECFLTASHCS